MSDAAALTVVICTHNPRPDYFGQCVSALRAQTLPTRDWELIVVDNASSPDKAPKPELTWHSNARLIQEPKLGLTHARLLGIREAAGSVIVFVDDDNVLDPDFLDATLRVAREKPFLGSWSGQSRGGFEETPPDWTQRYWGNLVIRKFDSDRWSNLPRLADTMPCGAGLCVRRAVAQHYLRLHDSGERSVQLDRVGTSLLAGGDNDLAACACDLGLGVGLVAALKLTHLIAPQRLTEEYLARLSEGTYYSSTLLDAMRGIPQTPRGAIGRIVDFLRVLRARPPHRRILQAAYRGRDRAVEHLQQTIKP